MYIGLVIFLFWIIMVCEIVFFTYNNDWVKPFKDRAVASNIFFVTATVFVAWLLCANTCLMFSKPRISTHQFFVKEDYKGRICQYIKLESGDMNVTEKMQCIVPDNKLVKVTDSSGYYCGIYIPRMYLEIQK